MSTTLNRRQFLVASASATMAKVFATPHDAVQAQGLTSINVAMSFINLDGVPAWIAQDLHLFEKYGLNVNIISFQGGQKAVTAMATGDVSLGLLGAADVVNARSQGFPLEVIGAVINRFAFDFVVAKNINSPAQLKGTKGAISGIGGSSHSAVLFALGKLGLNPQDVTLLAVGDEANRLASLQSGQIQFTVLTAGMDLVAFDLGFKPLLKLYELDQPFPQTAIAVNVNWVKTHAPIVDGFLKGIIAASVYIKNPLHTAAALSLIHHHLPINENHLRQGFLIYRDHLYTVYPALVVPGVEFVLREKKITQPASDFYDTSYLQALQNANFAATVGK